MSKLDANNGAEECSSSKKRKSEDTLVLESEEKKEQDDKPIPDENISSSTRGVRTRSRSSVVVTNSADVSAWEWVEGMELAIVNENGTVLHRSLVGKLGQRHLLSIPIRLLDKKKTVTRLVIDANRECGQYVLQIGKHRYGMFNRRNVYLVVNTTVLVIKSEYEHREKANKQKLEKFMKLLTTPSLY